MDGRTSPISLVLFLLDVFYIFPSSKITLIVWLQSLREVMFRNNLFGRLFFMIEESLTHTVSCCLPNLQSVLAMTYRSLWKGISQTETRKLCIWSLTKSKKFKGECSMPQCPQVDGPHTLRILPELVPAYVKGILLFSEDSSFILWLCLAALLALSLGSFDASLSEITAFVKTGHTAFLHTHSG